MRLQVSSYCRTFRVSPLMGILLLSAFLAAISAITAGFVTGSIWGALLVYSVSGAIYVLLFSVLWYRNAAESFETGRSDTAANADYHIATGMYQNEASTSDSLSKTGANWWQCRPEIVSLNTKSRLLFFCKDPRFGIGRFSYSLAAYGFSVDICDDLDAVLATASASPSDWYALVVDVDDAEGDRSLADFIGELSCFRSITPEIPIVLISENFLRDDLDLHRQSISDISLRAEVSMRALVEGIRIARANRNFWLDRMRDDSVEK